MVTDMNDKLTKQQIGNKLMSVRAGLLIKEPFYGHLLMKLKFALMDCGTAGTDMRRMVFDPAFVGRLSIEELEFIMEHEVLHCVLQHPLRGDIYNQRLYNIAADIVVNSNILQSRNLTSFTVDGEEAMHMAPNGKPGYLYTAEEVYKMLLDKTENPYDEDDDHKEAVLGNSIDNHSIWSIVPVNTSLADEWEEHLKLVSAKNSSAQDIPPSARAFLEDMNYKAKLRWRDILDEFIQTCCEQYDYTFQPYDHRFSMEDFILPAFWESQGNLVDNLWFLIDASGSIDTETMTAAFSEIKNCIEQFNYIDGKLSFFDTSVTEPVAFESAEDLADIEPYGGGGTSFHCIFQYMRDNMVEDLPRAIIIITDGYADYPDKEETMGVPVLWILVDDDMDAPWGKSIHL